MFDWIHINIMKVNYMNVYIFMYLNKMNVQNFNKWNQQIIESQ